jgi:hypothetical protein
MVNDVPVGFHEPFPRRTTSLPSCVLYINISMLTHHALVFILLFVGLAYTIRSITGEQFHNEDVRWHMYC